MAAYGRTWSRRKGNITVNSDAMRQVLDWYNRPSKTLPDSVYAYDNASNNKELISGKSALILNAPSAYAVAVRDKPEVARQLWTFPPPKGPKGRFDPAQYYFWGIWNFSKNIPAAKSLLAHLATRDIQEQLVKASSGFDIPPVESFMDFKTWEEVEPPKYTIYNFPPRDDVIPHLPGYPAPLQIGTQMWAQAMMMKMIAQHTQTGLSANDAIAWAESELESYMRDLANTGPFLSISLQRIRSEWRTKWEISGRNCHLPLLYASARLWMASHGIPAHFCEFRAPFLLIAIGESWPGARKSPRHWGACQAKINTEPLVKERLDWEAAV